MKNPLYAAQPMPDRIKTISGIFAIFVLTCSLNSVAVAQKINHNFTDIFPSRDRLIPVLDSSVNVTKLSWGARNMLIEKMYEVDQLYRAKLYKIGWASQRAEAQRYNRLMAINSYSNEALLLKILRLDGWPCDTEKKEKALSHKAWFIAWHAQIDKKIAMYPYLKKANQSKCIGPSLFSEYDAMMKRIEKGIW